MKRIVTLSLAFCFVISAAVCAQDTRITPRMPNSGDGIKVKRRPMEKEFKRKKSDSSTCEGEKCPIIAEAMESLPKMVFRVGDEETCCHMTATRMAHEAHERIVYVVGKKKFKDSQDAFESLVKQTEIYVKNYVTPKVCDESGATTLAGETCNCSETAAKRTELVSTATKDLRIQYRVGHQTFDKYHDARRHAKKTHQKGSFVVADESFENELEARLALAHQKFRSAVAVLRPADATAAKAKTSDAETTSETKTKANSDKAGMSRDG